MVVCDSRGTLAVFYLICIIFVWGAPRWPRAVAAAAPAAPHFVRVWVPYGLRVYGRVPESQAPFSRCLINLYTCWDWYVILILLNYNLLRIISMYRQRSAGTPRRAAPRRCAVYSICWNICCCVVQWRNFYFIIIFVNLVYYKRVCNVTYENNN